MDTHTVQDATTLSSVWKYPVEAVGCVDCHQVFLTPAGNEKSNCPICGSINLSSQTSWQRSDPPELLIPFNPGLYPNLTNIVKKFVDEVWLKADDFNTETLSARLRPVYWTQWLVDCKVQGHWKAEAGFYYQVKSSVDNFIQGQWTSTDHLETRVRWENRLGQIQRAYQNIAAPAFSLHNRFLQMIGGYGNNPPQGYSPASVGKAWILSPDLQPDEVWDAALTAINQAASAEVQTACSASLIRNFYMEADYPSPNWTQMLMPVYISGYQDDEGQYHPVFINGQTGQISGARLASQRKGWQWASILAGLGLIGLLAAILSFVAAAIFAPAAILGTILIVLAIILGLCAIIPAAAPWQWNRNQNDLFTQKQKPMGNDH